MALSNLNIEVKDNMISNIDSLMNTINSVDMNDDLLAYLEIMLNHIKYSDYLNKDELVTLITAVIIDYKNEIKNNQEALHELQEYNQDLSALSIHTTKAIDNDSGRDIDYISYVNEQGEVEVLACQDSTTISNFIKDNANNIAAKSAKEIFHYFKEYVHVELNFQTNEELMRDNPEKDKQAKKNDEVTKNEELEILEEYKRTYSLPQKIELTIDQYGERLYRIGSGLFKFKDGFEGRELVPLQLPVIKKELNESDEKITNIQSKPEESNKTITDEDIEVLENEDFIQLVFDKIEMHYKLTKEQERKMLLFAANIVNNIEKWYQATDFDPTVEEYFKMYMSDLEEKYDNINFDTNSITPEEQKLVEDYRNVKTLAKRNVKMMQLKPEEKRAGVASAVIILEIIIIAIFVLSFITLDI